MSAAVCPSEQGPTEGAARDPLAAIRARGMVELEATGNGSATYLVTLGESGGYRCKFPDGEAPWLDAAIVNTGGGVAGGDQIDISVRASGAARLRVGTATAERIYRSLGAPTVVRARLDIADNALLVWTPQPTIVFSGSRLDRRYDIDIAGDAALLMAETICFGRRDSGERMGAGGLLDRWFVKRDGRLAHAEITRIDADIGSTLERPAVLGGAHVASTLIYAGRDAEDHLEAVRDALPPDQITAAGCRSGLLIIRTVGNRLEQVERINAKVSAVLLSRCRFAAKQSEIEPV